MCGPLISLRMVCGLDGVKEGGGLLRNNKQRGWVGGGELQRREWGWGLEMGGNSDFDASLVERLTASVTQQSCEATEQ